MNNIIEYNKILEVTDYKGVTHFLINLKCIVTVVEPDTPFQNTPHSMSFVFSEINFRY